MSYKQANAHSSIRPSTLKEKRMKKILILLSFITIGSLSLLAQAPPHPPSTGNNGGANGFVGGAAEGAPIGNGTLILLTLAVFYTGRKVYERKSKTMVE
jgi:hypothetical protein